VGRKSRRNPLKVLGDLMMGRPPPGFALKDRVNLDYVVPLHTPEELAEIKREATDRRLRSEDEACWIPRQEMLCPYCHTKGQMDLYKLPGSEEVQFAKRRSKENYPNLRCGNCSTSWRDSALT
jgi:hypothetical protein